MGSGMSSRFSAGDRAILSPKQCASPFKQLIQLDEAYRKYLEDKTLNEQSSNEELELRSLLDDKIAFRHMKLFSQRYNKSGLLVCWQAIEQYRISNVVDIERLFTLTNACCSASFQEPAIARFGAYRSRIEFLFRATTKQKNEELPQLFLRIQRCCFESILLDIYLAFQNSTKEYAAMCSVLRTTYNMVKLQDFEYVGKLGSGKYGLVVHCRKISTGIHYAMKIQSKYGLLQHFKKNPDDVIVEMRANSSCRHPYLTQLAYAFQTSTLALMVMTLCECGDLNRSLSLCPEGRMPLDRVQFYTAEIISALCYLHENELIYRDLKPANVLLNAEGHIMLADFGSLADVDGRFLQHKIQRSLPLFAPTSSLQPARSLNSHRDMDNSYKTERKLSGDDLESLNGVTSNNSNEENVKRAKSLVGTIAYMAPEVVELFSKKNEKCMDGYTMAVDWWSLGVLIYKLLVGQLPFKTVSLAHLQTLFPMLMTKYEDDLTIVFIQLFGRVDYKIPVTRTGAFIPPKSNIPMLLNPDAIDFISRLLTIDVKNRLGRHYTCQKTVYYEDRNESEVIQVQASITSHPFLKDIDWDALEKQSLIPPYLPGDIETLINTSSISGGYSQSDIMSSSLNTEKSRSTHSFNDIVTICEKPEWVQEYSNENIWNTTNYSYDEKSEFYSVVSCPDARNMKIPKDNELYITENDQTKFIDWAYVSPDVIDAECKLNYQHNRVGALLKTLFGKK